MISFSQKVKNEIEKNNEDRAFTSDAETNSIEQSARRRRLAELFTKDGTVADPNKAYQFEILCKTEEEAEEVQSLIASFDIPVKTTLRKNTYVVYVKEHEAIAQLLGLMGANSALFEYENAVILKDMRGRVNRQVNCEAANIKKTVNSAMKQIESIELIEREAGLESLPKNLYDVARVRLQYPNASLADLGEHLSPPVGKSGVNHRLRRIIKIAEDLSK